MFDTASLDKVQELLPGFVVRVEVRDWRVERIIPVDGIESHFERYDVAAEGQDCAGVAPPDGLEPPTQALGRPRSVH